MYKHIPSSSKSNKTSICLRRTKKLFARKQSESQGRLTGLAGRQCRQGVKGTSYLKSLLKNPKPDARTTVAVVSWVIQICWEMVPGHINATCEQEALGLSEKWNESTTSLKGLPAQNVTPCPRQLSEASAIPWGSCSSILSNTATHTDGSALKKWKGRTSLVAQWVRTRLPTRGTWVWSLVRGKIPYATGHLSPGAPTAEPAPQQEEPPQWGTGHQTRSRPARSTGDPGQQEINNEWVSF